VRTELAIAAVALAAVSLLLFVLAIRRLYMRQADVTVTMLRRYDDRLAEFAQTLNDALTAIQRTPALAALELEDDPEPMMRTLEVARERTGAAGAIALFRNVGRVCSRLPLEVSRPPRSGRAKQTC